MKILLIEDDDMDAKLLTDIYLRGLDVDVERVQLLRQAIESKGTYDTILLDLKLPNSHGAHAVKEVAERYLETPIIVITGDSSRESILEAHKNGARDYIPKEKLTIDRLKQALVDAMEAVTRLRNMRSAERSINDSFGSLGVKNGTA